MKVPQRMEGYPPRMEEKFQTHFSLIELGISMIDLARLRHRLDEFVDQIIMQFKRARM